MTMQSRAAARLTGSAPAQPFAGLCRFVLARILQGASHGTLLIVEPSGRRAVYRGSEPGADAQITFKRWRTLRRFLTAGHLGFGEAYVAGDFETPDVCALLTWALQNEQSLSRVWQGSLASRLASILMHLANRNTIAGSRRNIAAHYDLGNDFYTAWLDKGMQYSSAIYSAPDQSLEAAQEAKLDRIVELLAPEKADRVLEIGCGWGALAERLAVACGCHVTGLTLSTEQLGYAHERLARVTLAPELRLEDYRSLQGVFDRIASVEMIEAVGEAYWPTYFATLRRCLKAGGRAVIQAITINERYFPSYRAHPDFIQKYIFPGGMLPTPSAIRENCGASGLKLGTIETFGQSYAMTLAEWRRRFTAAFPGLRSLGFDDEFFRKWDYYLAYCEIGFRLGILDVGFYVMEG